MPMNLPKPCLDCQRLTAPGRNRCADHERAFHARRTAHRRATVSDGQASRLRYAVNRIGCASCAECGATFSASSIEVDHRVPLADGGTDTTENLQLLCRGCHSSKTTAEAAARRASR